MPNQLYRNNFDRDRHFFAAKEEQGLPSPLCNGELEGAPLSPQEEVLVSKDPLQQQVLEEGIPELGGSVLAEVEDVVLSREGEKVGGCLATH